MLETGLDSNIEDVRGLQPVDTDPDKIINKGDKLIDAVAFANRFKDFEDLLKNEDCQKDLRKNLKEFENFLHQLMLDNSELITTLILISPESLTKIEPRMALMALKKCRCKKASFYPSVFETVAKRALDSNPIAIFYQIDAFEGWPKKDQFLEKAVNKIAKDDPSQVVNYASLYIDQPYGITVFKKALKEVDAHDVRLNFKENDPHTQEILMIVATEKPLAILIEADELKHLPNWNEILEAAVIKGVQLFPQGLVTYAHSYFDQPYGPKFFKKAINQLQDWQISLGLGVSSEKMWMILAEERPMTVYPSAIKDLPFAKNVLSFVCNDLLKKNPVEFIEYIKLYSGKIEKFVDNIDSLKHQAIEKIVEEDPFYFKANLLKDPEIRALFGSDFKILKRRNKENISLAKKAENKPSEKIQATDFPLNQKEFTLYLSGMNEAHHQKNKRGEERLLALISIPMFEFKAIFFNKSFQSLLRGQSGQMNYMNAISLSQAVYRELKEHDLPINEINVENSGKSILEQWEKVENRELFGPSTKLILFTHEGIFFNNKSILRDIYYRSGGKKGNILANEKGPEMKNGKNLAKERILKAIIKSKGPTTILFNGHGSPENWGFSKNQVDDLDHSLENHPNSIDYMELGNALIASGNIKNINLIGDTCFAYDYVLKLYAYLESKGISEKPYIAITSANKERYGWTVNGRDLLLGSMNSVSISGKPITVKHFFEAEALMYRHSDPALFIGKSEQYPEANLKPDSQDKIPSASRVEDRELKIEKSSPLGIENQPTGPTENYEEAIYFQEIAQKEKNQVSGSFA